MFEFRSFGAASCSPDFFVTIRSCNAHAVMIMVITRVHRSLKRAGIRKLTGMRSVAQRGTNKKEVRIQLLRRCPTLGGGCSRIQYSGEIRSASICSDLRRGWVQSYCQRQSREREVQLRWLEREQLERWQCQSECRFGVCPALPSHFKNCAGGGHTTGRFRRFDPPTEHASDLVDDLLELRVFLQINSLSVFCKTHEHAQKIQLQACLFKHWIFHLFAALSGKEE